MEKETIEAATLSIYVFTKRDRQEALNEIAKKIDAEWKIHKANINGAGNKYTALIDAEKLKADATIDKFKTIVNEYDDAIEHTDAVFVKSWSKGTMRIEDNDA